MNRKVTITNNSGEKQSIAIILADPSDSGAFSLVWLSSMVHDGVTQSFDCSNSSYALGWGQTKSGATPAPISNETLYSSSQYKAVDPGKENAVPLSYESDSFTTKEPYTDQSLDRTSQLMMVSDSSFSVSTSQNIAVALSVGNSPAIAVQAAPNEKFIFDVDRLKCYMLVTSAQAGTALSLATLGLQCNVNSFISITPPAIIPFSPSAPDLCFELTDKLEFRLC